MNEVLVGYIIASLVCVFPNSPQEDCVIKQEWPKMYQTEYGCNSDLQSFRPMISAERVECVPVYRPSHGGDF